MFSNCLLVALGGAVGAVARYLTDVTSRHFFGEIFPLGTLLVNCTGSFALGVLVGSGLATHSPTRYIFGFGLLGAFTTFSTFSVETIYQAQHGHTIIAVLNIVLNLTMGIGGALLGMYLGKRFN
jgi:fluoride exporter